LVAKPMVPIGDIPLLGRIVSAFYTVGFRQFIVCYGTHEEQLTPYCQTIPKIFSGTKITLIRQNKPMGMADAVELTENAVYPEQQSQQLPFILTAGDILFSPEKIKELFYTHMKNHAAMTLALAHSTDAKMANGYGNVQLSGDKVIRIVEKPGEAHKFDDFYSEPMYLFNYSLFGKIAQVKPSKRGERELQDAMQMLIDDQQPIAGYNIINESIFIPKDGEYHITYPRDFLAMNFRMIHQFDFSPSQNDGYNIAPIAGVSAFIFKDATVGPNVYLGKGAKVGMNSKISNTYLFSGAIIDADCDLDLCIVYENVHVPKGTKSSKKIFLPTKTCDLV